MDASAVAGKECTDFVHYCKKSAARTWSVSSPGANAFISTVSGTSSLPRPAGSAKTLGIITRVCTPCRGAMHSGFMPFAAFDQDALDNKDFLAKGKLAMPALALGCEKSFGKTMAAASNVQEGVVTDSGHWVMQENKNATITMVRAFLSSVPSRQSQDVASRREVCRR